MGVVRSALNHLNAAFEPRLAQALPNHVVNTALSVQPCNGFLGKSGLVKPTSGLKCIIGCRVVAYLCSDL